MTFLTLNVTGPAIASAFLASLVEVVEAFTIILAVGTLRGWRPAAAGTAAALALLAILVVTLGPLLAQVPLQDLQLIIGILLMLFGMGWLRKAVLRAGGVIALHDEAAIFAAESSQLRAEPQRHRRVQNWTAALTVFKAVLLEGLEVVFIVIAVGSGQGLLFAAAVGALAACVAVLIIGLLVRKPLSSVPENTLKLFVGVLLSSFGVFWTGEGLGIKWWGHDLALPVFALVFLVLARTLIAYVRRSTARKKHEAAA